jgi:hypothetical protein
MHGSPTNIVQGGPLFPMDWLRRGLFGPMMRKCYGNVQVGHDETAHQRVHCADENVTDTYFRKPHITDMTKCSRNGCVTVGQDGYTSDGSVWWEGMEDS